MAYDSKVIIKILGDATNFNNVINSAETSLNGLKGILAKLGLGTSLAKVTKEVVSNTTQLESSLATASTLFGDVNVDMDNYTKKVMELSRQTGVASSAIVDASYQAMSSGVKVTEDMGKITDFMEQVTKLSVAGMTSVENAVDSVAKIWNAYGQDVITVEQISKNLVMTQNLGITTVDQLSQSLATVTPTASAFGVSLENIGASLSVMTKAGTDTARATTQLNAVISSLASADSEASKNLKKATKEVFGQEQSFSDLIKEGKNLQEILLIMKEYAEGAGISLVDLFSEMNAGRGALQIASDSTNTFSEYLKQMKSDVDIVGDTYEKMTGTTAKSWQLLANRLKNITINIGLGTGTQKILDSVYNLAEDVVDKLEDWTPAINRALTTTTVAGGILFAYIKNNLEKIPTWIADAFIGWSVASTIMKGLGLSKLETGALAYVIGLKLSDDSQDWEQVGKDIFSALATGLTIGTFAGSKAGALMFALELTGKYDLEQLGTDLGTWAEATASTLGDIFAEVFDPNNEYSSAVKEGTQKIFDAVGVVAKSCFEGIGTSLKQLFLLDILGAIKSAIYKGMEMTAKLLDIWDGGETGTKHLDIYKVYKARQEAPSASQFNDASLLTLIKQAETAGIDLETYLQDALSKIDTFEGENPVATIIEQDKDSVANVISEVVSEGIEIGTEEGMKKAEEIIKQKIEAQQNERSLNYGIGTFKTGNSYGVNTTTGLVEGIDPKAGYKAGYELGEQTEQGAKDALDIHSPSKVFEEIGEYAVEGLEKGMTEDELEQAKQKLDEVYTKLGEDIKTWLSEGMKDGEKYTALDAFNDWYEASQYYSEIGGQLDDVKIVEQSAITPTTTTTEEPAEVVKETKTSWQGLIDWLKNAGSSVGDWLFNDLGNGKTGLDTINAIYEQFGNLNSYVAEAISNGYGQEISAMEEARDTAKKYNELTIEEEKEYDKKIKALKKEQFEKQKRANIATAVMDGALAIMNIWSENEPITASILSAIAGATTVAQISAISSQQSGYEHGGLIGGHGYTGDKQQIWANAGELILNRTQQRAIADQLSYGGNTTVIQVEFSGNVFGDQQTVAEYVYDAIKTAQAQGALRAW